MSVISKLKQKMSSSPACRKLLLNPRISRLRWELAGSPATEARVPDSPFGSLSFQCNICGQANERKIAELGREDPSCLNCGSTVRMRAMVYLLSREMFGESLAIPDFPVRRDIRGMGMSDWEGYAGPLAGKFDYTNTYYHQEPHLDITDIDPALEGNAGFSHFHRRAGARGPAGFRGF